MSDYDTQAKKMDVGSEKNLSTSDVKAFMNKAEKSVPFFAKHFCNIVLTPKQCELIEKFRNEKNTIAVFNRGGGKSYGVSTYDTHELAFRSYKDGSTDLVNLYAPILDQSNIIFNYVDTFIKKNKLLNSFVNKFKVGGYYKFNNGNELVVRTASPHSHPKGRHPNKLQMDESQDIIDTVYYEAILPSGAAKGGKRQEIGTPSGRNHFWKTFNDDEDYAKVKQTWMECPYMMPGYCMECGATFVFDRKTLPTKMICPKCKTVKSGYEYVMGIKRHMPEEKFNQEFNCVWNTDVGMVWAYSLIIKMMVLHHGMQYEQGNNYYCGIDIAKSPNETVCSIGKEVGDSLEQVDLLRVAHKESWTEIMDEIYNRMIIYSPVTCIDATSGSQGTVVYDLLLEKLEKNGFGSLVQNIHAVDYTNKIKNTMADEVDVMAYNNQLRLINDQGQRLQMIAYQKKSSPSGNTVFFSDELSDIPQAVMLMVKAFKEYSNISNRKFQSAMGKEIGYNNPRKMPKNPYLRRIASLKRPR